MAAWRDLSQRDQLQNAICKTVTLWATGRTPSSTVCQGKGGRDASDRFSDSGVRGVESGIPSDRQLVRNFDQVEYTGDNGVYKVIDGVRPVIKWGTCRAYCSTGPADLQHVLQIDLGQGHLAVNQQQRVVLFEGNVCTAEQERIGQAGGDSRDAVGGAGAHNHCIVVNRPAGEWAEQIVVVVQSQPVGRTGEYGLR